jgi:hypothetical protein
MNKIPDARALGILLGLSLLCSFGTPDFVRPPLPVETSFNHEAGRGGWLLVKLRAESAGDLQFVVDTGSPITILDNSLEPKLGKCLGTKKLRYGYYQNSIGRVFVAPRLFMRSTRLLTGDRISTDDLHRKLSPDIDGILGVDCLRRYCIQFDFAAQKMRLLDPGRLSNEDLGKTLPLTVAFGCVFTRADCFGQGHEDFIRLDTGCIGGIDALAPPKSFRWALQKQKPIIITTDPGKKIEIACFQRGVFDDETYTNLTFGESDGAPWGAGAVFGLQFLARHLVTFNFPDRIIYLRRQSVGPLASGFFLTIAAEQFWVDLMKKGQLPGLSNVPQGELLDSKLDNSASYPFSQTFDFRKMGDADVYHYSVSRESEKSAWKLQRAWRASADGSIVDEFRVP